MVRPNIGAKLKKLRLKSRYTLDEVGKLIGVSKQTLYKYENNIVSNIPSAKIEALANLYKVSPALIMGWDEPTTEYVSFGKILKELRIERKVTQQELSDYLNISKSMISMYESNQRKPSYEMLKSIADFFNVDMNRLYGAPSNSYYIAPSVNAKSEHARTQEGILLDVVKDLSDEDLDYVIDLVNRLRGK